MSKARRGRGARTSVEVFMGPNEGVCRVMGLLGGIRASKLLVLWANEEPDGGECGAKFRAFSWHERVAH